MDRFINLKIKKDIWMGNLEISHEITEVYRIKREENLGQNSKKLQQQRDKDTP